MTKARLRIPTKTQYAFIEVDFEGTPNEIVAAYNEINNAYWNQKEVAPLADKEYNEFIDNLMLGESNHIETWEKCSPEQRAAAQVIKRSLKRLEARENRKQ